MANIKELLEKRGIKKEHIIKEMGINRNLFYEGITKGGIFSASDLRQISEVTGIPIKALQEANN